MIDEPQHAPGARVSERVINRGRAVQQDQRNAEDKRTDGLRYVASRKGRLNDNGQRDKTGQQSDSVRDAVGDCLPRVPRKTRFGCHRFESRHIKDMFKKPLSVLLTLGGAIVLLGAAYAFGHNGFHSLDALHRSNGGPADSIQVAQELFQKCGAVSGEAKTDCYAKPLDSLASIGEVRTAMGALAHLGDLDISVRRDGHVFAHGIGIAGGKRGGNVAATFAMCDPSNQSGCYHGVIQAYFAAAPSIGPKEVNDLCQPFRGPDADRWILFQCVHGMGHGFEMIYDHDLNKSLNGCDLLSDAWDKTSCYGGVFMENIVNVSMPKHPAHDMMMHGMAMQHLAVPFKAVDPTDPLYPCSAVGLQYQESCYEMQTSVILYLNHGDIGRAAKTCDTAPNKMRFVCYQSLGRDISAYALQDPARSKQMCSLGTPAYQPWCYYGLVKNFVDLNARASDGLSFCKAVDGDANKMKCYEAVGEEIGTLRNDAESRKNLCIGSEAAYLNACLFGARVIGSEPPPLIKLNAMAQGV